MADCMKKHSKADVLVSFASLRSAYESTVETMEYPQVHYHNYSTLIWEGFFYEKGLGPVGIVLDFGSKGVSRRLTPDRVTVLCP